MRRSRRLTWVVFALCTLLVVDVLAWMTIETLRLERREQEARRQADLKELVRRVLWDMESLVLPIITTESSRPYFHYRAFYSPERAYTRMFEELDPDDVLQPSPLLSQNVAYIRLHYEIDERGVVTSPQSPTGNMQDLAEARGLRTGGEITMSRVRLLELEDMLAGGILAETGQASDSPGEVSLGLDAERDQDDAVFKEIGKALAKEDFASRRQVVEQASNRNLHLADAEDVSRARGFTSEAPRAEVRGDAAEFADLAAKTEKDSLDSRSDLGEHERVGVAADEIASVGTSTGNEGPLEQRSELAKISRGGLAGGALSSPSSMVQAPPAFIAIWRQDPASGSPELFFERQIRVGSRTRTQGFWIDWATLRGDMLNAVIKPRGDVAGSIAGDFRADLLPMSLEAPTGDELRLASLPVRLVPTIIASNAQTGLTPIRVTLGVTWLATLVAIGAIAIVLRAATVLSERRGRFVSAVTHELRTPMTTFRMYSEMLASGMVTDEAKRDRYLNTLRDESGRLSRIVESVLAYARLDRSRAHKVSGSVEAVDVLDRIRPAIELLAEHTDTAICFDFSAIRAGVRIPDDPEAIERICCNLVDNACKYGRGDESRVEVSASVAGSFLRIRVRDFGGGIPWNDRSRVFAAFDRSSHEGDSKHPGLGLGLALARGLARGLGGNLALIRHDGPGTIFELRLPVSP